MAKRKREERPAKGGKTFDLDKWVKKAKSKIVSAKERVAEGGGAFEEFGDGRYKMKLLKASIGPSASGSRIQVTTEYKFLDGDYKGKTYRAYRGVETEDDMFYFLKDAQRLGYDVDDFEPADMKELLKQMGKDQPVIIGQLRTKDGSEYQNLLIRKIVNSDDDDEDEDEDEDDAPKKKKKKGKKSKDDDEEEDEDDDEEEDEEEEDEKPKRGKGKKKKDEEEEDEDEDEDEDEEEDDEDDEEEEEKPKKKKGKGRKAKDEEEEEDEDEDDEDEDEEDEDEEDEDEDDELAVVVGATIKAKLKDGTAKVEVIEVLDDAVKVKTKDGKTVKVPADRILDVVSIPKKGKKR